MAEDAPLVPLDAAVAGFLADVLDDLLLQVADADSVRTALAGLGVDGSAADPLVAFVSSQAGAVAVLAEGVPALLAELARDDPDLVTVLDTVQQLFTALSQMAAAEPPDLVLPGLPDAGSVVETLLALAVERVVQLRAPAGWVLAKALHLVGPEVPFLTVLTELLESPTGFIWRRFQHLRRHLDITVTGIVSGPLTTSVLALPVGPADRVAPEITAALPTADVLLQRLTLRLAADTYAEQQHALSVEVVGHDPGGGSAPEFVAVALTSEPLADEEGVRLSDLVTVQLDPFDKRFGVALTGWSDAVPIADGTPSLALGTAFAGGFTFGPPGGLRLQLSEPVLEPHVTATTWHLRFGLEAFELTVPPDIAGPVLALLLPEEGVRLRGKLVVVVDEEGIHAEGGVGLRTTWPDTLRLPGIFVRGLTTEIGTGAGELTLTAAGTVTVDLGVLTVTVEGLGISQPVELRTAGDGNLGLLHLGGLALASPTGIGVSIDAGVVKGGGFLRIEERGASGALELALKLGAVELAIRAVGVVESVEGHLSFVVVMSVEFSPPIELFLGLTLNAVGGVFGINRTLDSGALTATVRSGRMEDVMFPRDLAARAVEVIDTVKPIFPARVGQVVAGPMLKLGWGRPVSFVTVDVGVVFTFPDPVVVAIIGSLRIALPVPEVAVVDIRADFAGTINASTGEVSFDASLARSRIATFDVTGDIALRAGPSGFLFTAGGFYPGFPVPAGLGQVRRLGISIAPSPLLSIRADAYFAVTASTVQFGGGLAVVAELGPIGARGHLTLDVLIRLNPLWFTAELRGQFRLSFKGADVLSADLVVLLEGPERWRARARAEISFLFFSVSGSLEVTWGELTGAAPPAVDVAEKVRTALEAPPVWAHVLPAEVGGLVTLRDGASGLHPLGKLRLTQTVAPLDVALDHFGAAAVTDAGPVQVTVVSDLTTPEPADELFAAAQYFELTDEEKLSKPAFVPHRAGYVLHGSAWAPLADSVVGEIVYEESAGDAETPRGRRGHLVGVDEAMLGWSVLGAAGRAHDQRSPVAQPLAGVTVTDVEYAPVDAATGAPVEAGGFGLDRAFAASTRVSADTVVMADYELAGLVR